MDNLTTDELATQVQQLNALVNSLQIQLQSQKLLIETIVDVSSDDELIADKYQERIEHFEKSTNKMMPNILISC